MIWWYRFLLAIRSRDPGSAEQILRDADPADCHLVDGHVGLARRPRGAYQFVSVPAARTRFPDVAWPPDVHPEPMVGTVRGYLNVEWWSGDADSREYDVLGWLMRGHGYLVDTTDGAVFDFVVRREWPLAEAFLRHGFDDGDFFLSRSREHLDVMRQLIGAELVDAGVKPEFITYGTHHNPLLVQLQPTAAVDARTVALWGWNWPLPHDQEFRARLNA